MSGTRHIFQAHGNAAVTESDSLAVTHSRPGSLVTPRTAGRVSGWIHVPISCAKKLDGKSFKVKKIEITIAAPSKTEIQAVHAYVGQTQILRQDNPNINEEERETTFNFDLPQPHPLELGLSVSLNVGFGGSDIDQRSLTISSVGVHLTET
jgi:hypothetical protein